MTISSTISRVSYAGNGATTAFPFPYYFLSNTDLVVIERASDGTETTKAITTHYSVAGAGTPAGGTVTMVTAPASGVTLIIYRNPALTQDLDLVENDSLPAEEVEKRYDKLTMISQRLSDRVDRSVRLTEGFAATFDPQLPATISGSKYLQTNSAGTGWQLAAGSPSSGSGGGGGSLFWVESVDSAIPSIESNQQVYLFSAAQSQKLYATIKVPASYTAGTQINLVLPYWTPDTSGTILMQSISTLIRPLTDAITSTTNQRTSTNGAVTITTSTNVPHTITLDLTSATGSINSVAVSANDLILVQLTRGTDSATSDVRVPVYGAEVST